MHEERPARNEKMELQVLQGVKKHCVEGSHKARILDGNKQANKRVFCCGPYE